MNPIGRFWAGSVFGTNTGNLFAELTSTDAGFGGIVRFLDTQFGVVVYGVTGTFDGTNFQFSGSVQKVGEGVEAPPITANGKLASRGEIRGQWSTTAGTGGTFVLWPHDTAEQSQEAPGQPPERIHIATRKLGAVRLYADDVVDLIGFLARDFKQPRVVVTYHERGNEISRYSSDFVNDLKRLGELRYLKLLVQEPEMYGINRVAMVEFNGDASNEVKVQGVQEAWVTGKAEALTSHLRSHEKALSTSVRKLGFNLYTLIGLGTLIALPELTLNRRIAFVAIIALGGWVVARLHSHFIPNVAIHLSEREPTPLQRAAPQIVSWLIAASSALAATIAYGALRGELGEAINWLRSLFS